MGPIIDKWVTNKNVWLQRTAILHQLLYKEQTDQEKLFQYCLICAVEEDLVIKKAIGWALRNQFEVNPVAVKDFVRRNHFKLSKLSKREALKHA